MENTTEKFESWAVLELFGHQQLAGLVTEASIGGCSFLRVDVPAVNDRPAFTKYFGDKAIYSMLPCGEEEAMIALKNIMPRPVSPYLIPERAAVVDHETEGPMTGPDGSPVEIDDDEDDEEIDELDTAFGYQGMDEES